MFSFSVRQSLHLIKLALTLLFAVGVVTTMVPASAAASSSAESQISRARSELRSVREELETARETAESEQVALEEADRQLRAAFVAVEEAQAAVDRQRSAVQDATARLEAAHADLTLQRGRMADRVARMYTEGAPSQTLLVLGSSSISDAVRKSTYMAAIGRNDRAAVEHLDTAERRVAGEERTLQAEESALERVLAEQEAVLGEVDEMRQDQALVAAASQELVEQLQARESHLAAEEAELSALIRRQNAVHRPASSGGGHTSVSGSGSGQFGWPAAGTLTSGFGQRWGRLHAGIDVAASPGTPISAAASGTVIHAGRTGGYGNLVLVSHGNGFVTAYGHLSSIAVSNGQSVSRGAYLGGMGCTGRCTGTHVHFEIRVNGQAVNPMGYL